MEERDKYGMEAFIPLALQECPKPNSAVPVGSTISEIALASWPTRRQIGGLFLAVTQKEMLCEGGWSTSHIASP